MTFRVFKYWCEPGFLSQMEVLSCTTSRMVTPECTSVLLITVESVALPRRDFRFENFHHRSSHRHDRRHKRHSRPEPLRIRFHRKRQVWYEVHLDIKPLNNNYQNIIHHIRKHGFFSCHIHSSVKVVPNDNSVSIVDRRSLFRAAPTPCYKDPNLNSKIVGKWSLFEGSL